jgi:signal transduction histidine kinase
MANTLYRVVQEALTNVARHAHATMATVELKAKRSAIQLRIKDNGIGFDPAALLTSASGGIIGMQERINLVGGTLRIQSEPGVGTLLVADIPYRKQDKEEGGQ